MCPRSVINLLWKFPYNHVAWCNSTGIVFSDQNSLYTHWGLRIHQQLGLIAWNLPGPIKLYNFSVLSTKINAKQIFYLWSFLPQAFNLLLQKDRNRISFACIFFLTGHHSWLSGAHWHFICASSLSVPKPACKTCNTCHLVRHLPNADDEQELCTDIALWAFHSTCRKDNCGSVSVHLSLKTSFIICTPILHENLMRTVIPLRCDGELTIILF